MLAIPPRPQTCECINNKHTYTLTKRLTVMQVFEQSALCGEHKYLMGFCVETDGVGAAPKAGTDGRAEGRSTEKRRKRGEGWEKV